MLVGKNVTPHTIDVKDSQTGICLTEQEKRRLREKNCETQFSNTEMMSCLLTDTPTVSGYGDQSTGYSCPSKPQCVLNTDGTTTCSNDTTFSKCYAAYEAMKEGSSVFMPVNTEWYKVALLSGGWWLPVRPTPTGCSVQADCSTVGSRITIDPQCRSLRKQFEDNMAEIMKDNPYYLVETTR